MKKKDFVPVRIGTGDFANGSLFHIDQINKRGGCRITDKLGNRSYAHNLANAWANVRYQAKIIHHTERSA